MKTPKISIIVPVYNSELFLDKCIKSIINQDYKDFELILINDGSTDNSGKICDEYSKEDIRIKVIHKPNGGQSSARNVGINLATGDYISFIDADDYISSSMIQTLYTLITNYKADISECGYISVYKDKQIICGFGTGIEVGEGSFLTNKFVQADIFYGVVTKLFNSRLFDNVRFPQGRIYEDTWMTLNFCLEQLRYVRTHEPLYYYNQSANSTLRSNLTQRKAREYIYILESQLSMINTKIQDNGLKELLHDRIMEKSVIWYLDLALSNQRIFRDIYSKLYKERMHYSIYKCMRSKEIPLTNKFSFILTEIRLKGVVRFVKNAINLLK